MKQGPKVLN
jgi:hypothetical protein